MPGAAVYGAVDKHSDEEEENSSDSEISFWGESKYNSSVTVKAIVLISAIVATFFVIDAANGRIGSSILSNLLVSTTSRGPIKSTVSVPYVSTLSGLTVSSVTNEYGDVKADMLPYIFLQGAYLFEPYRSTGIALSGMQNGCNYKWMIVRNDDSSNSVSGTVYSGKFTATLTQVGQYTLEVSGSCSSEVLSQPIWVKYVRRELSSLNDQDREDFLDAFHTLWTVSTVDGQKKYGMKYKSIYYFASIHNDAGGNSVCDEFHGGVGFLSNHMYLSVYLEQSLQLVNPKVALHYMEYTKYFESSDFISRKLLSYIILNIPHSTRMHHTLLYSTLYFF